MFLWEKNIGPNLSNYWSNPLSRRTTTVITLPQQRIQVQNVSRPFILMDKHFSPKRPRFLQEMTWSAPSAIAFPKIRWEPSVRVRIASSSTRFPIVNLATTYGPMPFGLSDHYSVRFWFEFTVNYHSSSLLSASCIIIFQKSGFAS